MAEGLRIIETIRWDGVAFVRLDRHLARLRQTCEALGFRFDDRVVRNALRAVDGGPKRTRLTVAIDGAAEVSAQDLPPGPKFWRVTMAANYLDPDDPWLRIKTTNRVLHDRARADLPPDIDEVIFLNTRGEVCEGTITNIFADLGDGLVTPPVHCGLLPGILRAEMLENGSCRERLLTEADLRSAWRLFAGNALRGLIALRFSA